MKFHKYIQIIILLSIVSPSEQLVCRSEGAKQRLITRANKEKEVFTSGAQAAFKRMQGKKLTKKEQNLMHGFYQRTISLLAVVSALAALKWGWEHKGIDVNANDDGSVPGGQAPASPVAASVPSLPSTPPGSPEPEQQIQQAEEQLISQVYLEINIPLKRITKRDPRNQQLQQYKKQLEGLMEQYNQLTSEVIVNKESMQALYRQANQLREKVQQEIAPNHSEERFTRYNREFPSLSSAANSLSQKQQSRREEIQFWRKIGGRWN